MKKRKYPLLILLCCLIAPVAGFSQYFYFYTNPLAFGTQISRYTSGYSYIVNVNATYTGLAPLYGDNGNKIKDTMVTNRLSSIKGVGYILGVTMPITRTGKRSSIDVSLDFMLNAYAFEHINPGIKSDGKLYSSLFSNGATSITTQYALPVSIDFKFGSDAIAVRTTRFGGAIGAGMLSQYQVTDYTGISFGELGNKAVFSATPFVKAEFSVYLFFCFRVKAFYSMGDIDLFEEKTITTTPGRYTTSKLTTNNSLVISLTTLPFSFLWYAERRSHGWWDDFETERPWR